MKDFKTSPYAVITELHSTRQDTYAIRDLIQLYKDEYEAKYKGDFVARLIVSDYSWASMHAIIQAFNIERIIDYADRVYDYEQNKKNYSDLKDKSWYISCCAHTMHRFVNMTKKFFKNKNVQYRLRYCFALLLNSTRLSEMSEIFKNIVVYFKSKTKNQQVIHIF